MEGESQIGPVEKLLLMFSIQTKYKMYTHSVAPCLNQSSFYFQQPTNKLVPRINYLSVLSTKLSTCPLTPPTKASEHCRSRCRKNERRGVGRSAVESWFWIWRALHPWTQSSSGYVHKTEPIRTAPCIEEGSEGTLPTPEKRKAVNGSLGCVVFSVLEPLLFSALAQGSSK